MAQVAKVVLVLLLLLLLVNEGSPVNSGSHEESLIPLTNRECEILTRFVKGLMRSSDKCVFFCTEFVPCSLHLDNVTIVSISLQTMFSGFVSRFQDKFFCDKIVGVFPNFETIRYLTWNRSLYGLFHPFTRIAFVTMKNEDYRGLLDSPHQYNQMYYNGLYLYVGRLINETFSRLENVLEKRGFNVYANSSINDLRIVSTSFQSHPLFKRGVIDKPFNFSLFHCPPHVIKLDDRRTLDSYDGAEFRFIRDITKTWNVKISDYQDQFGKMDTWTRVLADVEDHSANVGMCSVWLTEDKYKRFDVTKYFSRLCGTFLVPKPALITHASYIYLPLSRLLWFLIFGILLVTTVLYYMLYQHWESSHSGDRFENLSRAFLDVINIATAHGLPKILQPIPLRVLIISWILLCLLLGTAYTSKYTSILTQPMYTKAIDTIHDFIEEGLLWGEVGDRSEWKAELRETENPDYIELANRMQLEPDLAERLKLIPTGRYARFVKVLNNNYVTDTETFAALASQLRLMNSCISKHYTIFPLPKNSPFTRYVDMKLGQYTDSGIIDYWFRLMPIKYGIPYMEELFDKNRKWAADPKPLQLKNVSGAFYLLLIGSVASVIVYLLEVYVHKKKLERRRRISGNNPI